MAGVTIYDVAAYADVSIKTVSRVMNDGADVSAKTREKVIAAAEALGYHPNLSARSLAGSKSFVIAAFVDADLTMSHWESGRGTDYLTRIQLGATIQCREAGYHFMVELIDHDPQKLRQEVRALLAELKPDGVILTPPSSDNETVLEILTRFGTPFVRLVAEGEATSTPSLTSSDRSGARAMTDHLIELGHRRIGFIVGERRYAASRARLLGFQDAMEAAGLPVAEAEIQQGDFTFQSGERAAEALLALADRPTAIFASNDEMALGCLSALGRAGLSAPDDLSVAGFDDSASSRLSRPSLSTVRLPVTELAAEAAHALISGEVLAGAPLPSTKVAATFELIRRGSTAAPSSR
jgi:LacI family transcriptional regulator